MSKILEAVAGLSEQQQRAILAVAASADPYVHAVLAAAKDQIKGLDDLTEAHAIRLVASVLLAMHEDGVQAEVEAETKRLEAAAPAPSAATFQPKVKAQRTGTNYDA